jgi:hypothetical protein
VRQKCGTESWNEVKKQQTKKTTAAKLKYGSRDAAASSRPPESAQNLPPEVFQRVDRLSRETRKTNFRPIYFRDSFIYLVFRRNVSAAAPHRFLGGKTILSLMNCPV